MNLEQTLAALLRRCGRQVSVEGKAGSGHKALLFPHQEDPGEGYRLGESGGLRRALWRYYAAPGEACAREHEVLLSGGKRYLLLQVSGYALGEREIYRTGLCEELGEEDAT